MSKNQKPLNKKQLKCIEIMVAQPERSNTDIAQELKVNRATISVWLKREDFQQALKEENQRCFKNLAAKAINKLEQLMYSENERIVLDAAKEILNKGGYNEVQKIEQTIHNVEIEITE